jgi:hypothetical protein
MDAAMVHDRLRQHLSQFYALGVARLAVFGSIAHQQNTEASDLDILVRFHAGKKTFDNYMDVKFLLEELFPGVDIDLVLESSLKPAIRDRVLAEARDVA